MKYVLLIAMLVAPGVVCAQSRTASDPPSREHFAPKGMEAAYHDWHYTPVVKVGNTVIVSGIPAAGPGTYEDKVRRMFAALKAHLELAGSGLDDVVELTSFHATPTDAPSFAAEFARFAPIHNEFFPAHYPAWSAVGTTALLAPGAVVELRAVAMIGSGAAPRVAIPKPRPADEPPSTDSGEPSA